MLLKYLNKGIQLVKTIDGMKEVKEGEVFETTDNNGESRLRNYRGMFEKVEKIEEEKKEVKKEEKKWKKNK